MKKIIKMIVENIFYAIISCNQTDKIINKIQRYKYVSFDIFDTLVIRDGMNNPDKVLEIVEKSYNATYNENLPFKNKRLEAYKKAKRNSKEEEVTIYEIYNYLPFEPNAKKILMELELNIEKKVIKTNERIKQVYEYCIKNNKNIIITSDMYLPIEFITQLLTDVGYNGYYKLYLSSDKKLTKKTGHIFDLILKDDNINSKDIVHIGDSVINDYIMPRRRKIKSILIKRGN